MLLMHLNRHRGAATVCSVTARGRHPLWSSLIIARQKVALCCLCVPQRPPTAWEHRRTQVARSITIRGREGEGEREGERERMTARNGETEWVR